MEGGIRLVVGVEVCGVAHGVVVGLLELRGALWRLSLGGCGSHRRLETCANNRQVVEYVGNDGKDDHDDALFWQIVDEHPLCQYQQAYADFSAKRLSDVIERRQFVRKRVFADWFRPFGITAELEVGIARSRARTRNFVLDRCGGDFSDRDVAVLGMIAPHLAQIHETTQLRRAATVFGPGILEQLTTRELEVLELVAAGLTNAGIAERLWISPGTVKKHLDNVYAKLGVANRTAAAALIRPA